MSEPEDAKDFAKHWLEDVLADAAFEEVQVLRIGPIEGDAIRVRASLRGEMWVFGVERFPVDRPSGEEG